MQNYYHLCRQDQGKVARITERNGRVHVGRIVRVTNSKVYIAPVGGRHRGYGFGYWGGGWGGWEQPTVSALVSLPDLRLEVCSSGNKESPLSIFQAGFFSLHFLYFIKIFFKR